MRSLLNREREKAANTAKGDSLDRLNYEENYAGGANDVDDDDDDQLRESTYFYDKSSASRTRPSRLSNLSFANSLIIYVFLVYFSHVFFLF